MSARGVGLAKAAKKDEREMPHTEALLVRALPVLRDYAAHNPRFFSIVTHCEQDPSGVHELLAAIAALGLCSAPLLPPRDTLRIGAFALKHQGAGKVWLENADGEGLATDEAKLESLLEKFWKKEF